MPNGRHRKRSLIDILEGVDEAVALPNANAHALIAEALHEESLEEIGRDGSASLSRSLSQPEPAGEGLPTKQKRQEMTRTKSSSSSAGAAGASPLSHRSESFDDTNVFLSELGMQQRRAEGAVDAIMFAVEALPRATDPRPLLTVMEQLSAEEGVLGQVRKLGHGATFADRCCAKAHASTFASRAAHLQLIYTLSEALPLQVLSTARVVATMLTLLDPSRLEQAPTQDADGASPKSPSSPSGGLHWAARLSAMKASARKSTEAKPANTQFDADLLVAAGKLPGLTPNAVASSTEDVQLGVLRILTKILLSQNQQDDELTRSMSGDGSQLVTAAVNVNTPIAVLLARARGFDLLSSLLGSDETPLSVKHDVVQLLDLATCSTGLAKHDGSATAFRTIVLTVLKAAVAQADEEEAAARYLRVGVNVTSLFPTLFVSDEGSDSINTIAVAAKTIMLRSSIDSDVLVCTACMLINMLKGGEHDDLRWALLEDSAEEDKSLIDTLCEWVVTLRKSDEAAENVRAGYLTMILGLCSLGDETARVKVVTALVRHAGDSKIAHRPMLMVVAILQEFIMFQSSAGILTKQSLLTMYRLVDQLVRENKIQVEQDDDAPQEEASGTESQLNIEK